MLLTFLALYNPIERIKLQYPPSPLSRWMAVNRHAKKDQEEAYGQLLSQRELTKCSV